jgi:RNA polymerase sigma factor (sigma-70 family)
MRSARTIDALQTLIPSAEDCADAELLARYASSRSGAAFAELMRRHGSMVYGTCQRIARNSADADDAFQATFLILARSAHTIRSTAAVRSWLYGVAVKVARKAQQQAQKRRMRHMAAAKPEAVPPETPWADCRAVLDEELQRLPDVLRRAILACDVAGQSRSKAARELGWPEGTVAKRLAKAREELAKRLTRRGVTLSVAALSAGLAAQAAAAVPSGLPALTLSQVIADGGGAGISSAAVRTLVEGVMRSMKASVIRLWTITGLAALLCTGAGIMLAGSPTRPGENNVSQRAPESAARKEGIIWKESTPLETPGWCAGSIAWSPDSKFVVVGGNSGQVTAFDAITQKPTWKAEVGGAFAAVAFSADGKWLLATCRNGVRYLNPKTGAPGQTIEEPDAAADWPFTALAVFPDRTIDSGNEKLTSHKIVFGTAVGYVVKEWIEGAAPGTITTSTVAKDKTPPDPNAVPLAVDPHGRSAIMIGPIDRATGKNVVWAYVCGNYEEGSPGNRVLTGHQAGVVSAAWSKDGTTAVTGDAGGRVIVWDARSMKELHRHEFGQRVAALALTADGKHFAAAVVGKQAEFHVRESAQPADKMKPIHVDASDYAGPIHASVAFSPDGQRLAGTAYNAKWLTRLGELIGKVHMWEMEKR